MRRSSSTTSRCGASSASASATSAMVPPSALPARTVGPTDEAQDLVAAFGIDHGGEECARRLVCMRAEAGERARDPLSLQPGKLHGELFALRRGEKEAVTPVVRALLLHHVILVHQLLEHAAERLLGDAQDLGKVRYLHAGVAIDEMQHPMMRPAEM